MELIMDEIEIPVIEVDPTPEQLKEWAAWNNPQAVYEREIAEIKAARHAAYIAPDGSDALLAKYQLGEDGVTMEMVKARKDEINASLPYPEPPESS